MFYIRLRAVFCGLLLVLFVVLGTVITSASENNTTEIEEIEQPQSPTVANIPLPVGIPLYKIEVNEDGLYKVSYDDLQAAGMNVATVNPANIHMLYRGQEVSYEWGGNFDTIFDPGEFLIFYGWKFNGSRYERHFIENNIFWLWVSNTRAWRINYGPMQEWNSQVKLTTAAQTTITRHEEALFNFGSTNRWSTFDNEAYPWFWENLYKPDATPTAITLTVNAPYPADFSSRPIGVTASYTVEVMSRHAEIDNHLVTTTLNGVGDSGLAWNGIANRNITGIVPQTALNNSSFDNEIKINLLTDIPAGTQNYRIAIYRITIEYWRKLMAKDDQLIFQQKMPGKYFYLLSNFLEKTGQWRFWDISNPFVPIDIPISSNDIINEGGKYSYRIGATANTASASTYIATNQWRQPIRISQYIGKNLDPVGGAEWVAISYHEFIPQVQRLATHRQNYSGMKSFIADIEDINNQYGYGFALPTAIQNYLQHGFTQWATKPKYTLLVGTGSLNPLARPCPACGATWGINEKQLVQTNILYTDPFMGMIPSDHLYSQLTGDDSLPDIAVGRITAKTIQENKNAIDKILQFEANLATNQPTNQRIIFATDKNDDGGNFCGNSEWLIERYIPARYNAKAICLDRTPWGIVSPERALEWKNEVIDYWNNTGAFITNYRGHGAIDGWARGTITVADANRWQNYGDPTVLISADCLDGNFAYVNNDAISETFLKLDGKRGAVAHWGSTGLGYSYNHDTLHEHFYRTLLGKWGDPINIRIGDAINYAKIKAFARLPEMYSFLLQGDPAMPLLYIPPANPASAIAGPLASPFQQTVNGEVAKENAVNITVTNRGTISDTFTITVTDSAGWSHSVPLTVGPLEPNESIQIPLMFTIPVGTVLSTTTNITATVTSAMIDPLSDYTITAILTAQTENVPTAITLRSAQTTSSSLFWLILLLLITTLSYRHRSIRHVRKS